MRVFAVILNIIAFVVILLLWWDEGFSIDEEFLIFLFFGIVPIVNIIALVYFSTNGWFRLYFKRKALEEKKKIETLSDKGEAK